MTDLAMLVPTRGRPESVPDMARAWIDTSAVGQADLIWLIDMDDPQAEAYREQIAHYPWMKTGWQSTWTPMVPKLDLAACLAADTYPVLGFMGDDHRPRSAGWVHAITVFCSATAPQIVYGRDGHRDRQLPTWWAMTSDIVKTLGRMVPASVQHLYCDNAVQTLGEAAHLLTFLPHVTIEHMHPVAGKAEWDEGYRRVNRRQQYDRDAAAYRTWVETGLKRDATLLRELRGV